MTVDSVGMMENEIHKDVYNSIHVVSGSYLSDHTKARAFVGYMGGNERMKEVYKDPTAQQAIGNVTKIEKLKRKHNIHEGDVIEMDLETHPNPAEERCVTKKVQVRVKEVHTHLVTVILPSGLLESFTWWEFEERRR